MSSGASTSDLLGKARAFAQTTFASAVKRFGAMTRPARVMLVSTVIAAIALTTWLGYRSSATAWTPLFTNLDRDDAAAVVAKLKEMKVPYRVEGDGGSISVPEAQARELRLELAGAGLPRGGGVGFESFDKMRLGATEFEQRVLYRRSLEGELSRTIDTISAVQSSRVHIVLPERSVFVGRAEPASASVVLKLRSGRALGSSEIAGIVHLVSSSVAQLTPDHITVVTTDGTMLHKPRRGEGDNSDVEEQTSSARALEATLEERARSMLEKVVGAGKADVRVSVELDRSRVERTEDHYDPKNTTLRSEQSSIERTGNEPTAAGVPGAESNTPGGNGRADGGVAEGTMRESHTRNFEVDHVSEKRLLVSGTVRRLTVAVVVDGATRGQPRPKEEVERLTGLVRSAVGADDRRGDVVTLESVPFLEAEPAPAAPPPVSIVPPRFQRYVPYAAAGLLVLVLGGAAIAIRRARKRAAAKKAKEEADAKAMVVAEPEPVTATAEVEDAEVEKLEPEELRTRAHERAAEDPATAALVLRFWLGEGEERHPNGAQALGQGTPIA
ncbi:MAG: flagellar M-ring protein FliF [Deltaproteobacteria bacterium]|nr:flagellar M-ring protein FliF [Deltaproteobacteria bacterium]